MIAFKVPVGQETYDGEVVYESDARFEVTVENVTEPEPQWRILLLLLVIVLIAMRR